VLLLGRPLYALLGGRDAALAQALVYSQILFGGAVFVWLANTLASVLRGSGDTLRPAVVLAIAAALQIPLTGALTLGWGGSPALGIAGPAVAYIVTFGLAALTMALHLRPTRLWPRGVDWRLRRGPAIDILRVGAVSSLAAVQTVITAVVLTGLVATFGTAALAGYGVGVRLELLLVPIVFAIGQALVLMVGLAIGAGRPARAKKVAWTGAAAAFVLTLAIGGFVALFPQSWVGLFSQDPAVLDAGAHYLRIVGPFYPLFGAGMALYFASQGAGRVVFPVLAGTVRLVFVLCAGALAVSWARPVGELFAIIACGLVLFGVVSIVAVRRTRWGRA
jgi:Na+-driven multidrug efflux pump